MQILTVAVLPDDIQDARSYASDSRSHTLRKLEHQQSRYSNLERNIEVGRTARNVVARALREAGVATRFEESPSTR